MSRAGRQRAIGTPKTAYLFLIDSTRTMVERVEAQFDLMPERLIGDTAYGIAGRMSRSVCFRFKL
ncbi:hypothetical protein GQA94_14765 [Stutzerimonas stutzeri]|uniref:Uncharacterized protein n=1 Tax=Stutzerimonas stutzeri TaxID=316 RepID=A0A6I6LSB2_STUST|nr:hypothetical protein GQA94_14765 [Stutzerimonas stutzeri]